MNPETHFDAQYYERYYSDPRTAVISAEAKRHEVAFVVAFCRHAGLNVTRFADVGAGTGWWAKEFRRRVPSCRHVETYDASEAACRIYGHKQAAVQRLKGPACDLVVCRDVLRYLDDDSASVAIERLARKTRGILYVHVITTDDDIDEDMSDMAGFFRPASWYRKRFNAAGFTDCGMGLFASRRFETFNPFAIELPRGRGR